MAACSAFLAIVVFCMRLKHLLFFGCCALGVGACTRSCHARALSEAYSCFRPSACTWPQAISFEEKVRLIAARVGTWHDPTALFRSMDFAAIYRHPQTYQRYVLQLLQDSQIPLESKQIALYGMEQLPLTDYLPIVRHCAAAYRAGRLPLALLEMAAAYELAGDHPVVVHHADGRVQEVLRSLQEIKGLPAETLAYLDAIQTGTLYRLWQREKRFAAFRWAKKPLVFAEAIDAILARARGEREGIALEGHMQGTLFRLLYEHPECYLAAAHQLLSNPLPEPQVGGGFGVKYSLNDKRKEIVLNAMRKLDPIDFSLLWQQTVASGFRQPLIGSLAGSYWDGLLLKPYPSPSRAGGVLSEGAWKALKGCQEQQKRQATLRKRYNIPAYDEAKPFYRFDGEAEALLVCAPTKVILPPEVQAGRSIGRLRTNQRLYPEPA